MGSVGDVAAKTLWYPLTCGHGMAFEMNGSPPGKRGPDKTGWRSTSAAKKEWGG